MFIVMVIILGIIIEWVDIIIINVIIDNYNGRF